MRRLFLLCMRQTPSLSCNRSACQGVTQAPGLWDRQVCGVMSPGNRTTQAGSLSMLDLELRVCPPPPPPPPQVSPAELGERWQWAGLAVTGRIPLGSCPFSRRAGGPSSALHFLHGGSNVRLGQSRGWGHEGREVVVET